MATSKMCNFPSVKFPSLSYPQCSASSLFEPRRSAPQPILAAALGTLLQPAAPQWAQPNLWEVAAGKLHIQEISISSFHSLPVLLLLSLSNHSLSCFAFFINSSPHNFPYLLQPFLSPSLRFLFLDVSPIPIPPPPPSRFPPLYPFYYYPTSTTPVSRILFYSFSIHCNLKVSSSQAKIDGNFVNMFLKT